MGSDSIPQKLSDESINRNLVCTLAFHRTDSKDPDIHVRRVNAGNENTQHAPSTKTECDYLNGWTRSHTGKISPEMVNRRDLAGERRRCLDKCCTVATEEESSAT